MRALAPLAVCGVLAAPGWAAAPETGLLDVPGGKLWYEVRGAGAPVVLIHDGLLPSDTWEEQTEPFAREVRVVRYDRRRYGQSTTTTDDFSNVDDLKALLDHLRLEGASLVGCSSGGGLALDFALAHPGRVDALVLVGPVMSGFGYSGHFQARGFSNRAPALLRGDNAQVLRNWAEDPYITDVRNTAARARLKVLLERHPFAATGGNPGGKPPERPARTRLAEVKVPTLLVTGASDIPDVHAHIGAIAAGIPHAERALIPAAGHLVHLEKPAEFNECVLDFLASPGRVRARLAELTQGGLTPGARRAFDYDAKAPLDVQEKSREARGGARVVDLTYASPGGRVPAFLVEPERAGPHAGVVFLHHGQGDRRVFLDEAVELAALGVVSVTFDAPHRRPGYEDTPPFDARGDRDELVQTMVDLRRAIDLLESRPNVDRGRIGYVGYSLGATMGARLVGHEGRLKAFVLTAGLPAFSAGYTRGWSVIPMAFRAVLSAEAQKAWLEAHAPFDGLRFLTAERPAVPTLFQFARADEFIKRLDASLFEAAIGPGFVTTWYDGAHFSMEGGRPREERREFLKRTLSLAAPTGTR